MKTGHNKLYIAFSAWADIPVGDNMLITEAGTELGAGGGLILKPVSLPKSPLPTKQAGRVSTRRSTGSGAGWS